MNIRKQFLKIAVLATLLFTFQPISQIRAEGLAQTTTKYLDAGAQLPETAAYPVLPGLSINKESVAEQISPFFPDARPAFQKRVSVVSIEPINPFTIGEKPFIIVHLTTDTGSPIPNHLIRVFSYKNRKEEGVTDSTGTVRIPLQFNFYPGTYDIVAAFDGTPLEGLSPSKASAKLVIQPIQVSIQTVPVLAGVKFLFNNQTFVSDATGKVQFPVDHIGTYHVEVLPVEVAGNPNIRIDFNRWNDNITVPYREFRIPRSHELEAGFLISYPVTLKYIDQANQPVDPGRISLVNLKTGGTPYTFQDPSTGWLPANQLAHRVGSFLESKLATYYIQNVTIQGTNVVNQSQLRYQMHPNDTWMIKLFLFSAHFSATDALFHSPIGSGILLEYPNGTSKEIPFISSSAVIDAASLPRGLYHATVKGSGGIAPRMTLALSRDQKFEVLVLSRLDMEILFGIPALFALSLFFVGRLFPYIGDRIRQRAQLQQSFK